MSIKNKIALLISLIVALSLSLNISIYYFTTRTELRTNAETQMATIAKQVSATLESTEKTNRYLEELIGETLRNAALAAKSELDPRIDRVTNEQLSALSAKLGVDHITLWVRTKDDIVAVKSSEPKEIGISSKTWSYWHVAFQQLFDQHKVDIPQGQKLPNYWAGPIQYSTSDNTRIDKWGYYYDGTTDYIINPYVDAKRFVEFMDTNGTNELIRQLLASNPDILGIAGFDPEFFGRPPIVRMRNGKPVQNLDVREIPFGESPYINVFVDVPGVQRASLSGQMVTTHDRVNGKHVLKSFIPLGNATSPIIGVVFDHGKIEQTLNRQLAIQIAISLALVPVAWLASYFVAGPMTRPIRQILRTVDKFEAGRFDVKIPVRSRDEIGLLAERINTLGDNLRSYTDRLKETAEQLRGTKVYLESFVNYTSDAIHVTDLEGRVTQVNQAFEKMFGWREEEVIGASLAHVSEEHLHEYDDIRERILRGETVTDHETVRLTKNGNMIDMSITVSAIRNEKGDSVAIAEIARNITARKHAEEAIRRSEKLSVIGQLAAGVAHEIRNPLTTVRGFVQLQQQTGKLIPSHLEVMMSELDRINMIVSEFLVLAKPQARQYQLTQLPSLLSDIVMLLDTLAHMSRVTIETRYSSGIPPIYCEPNQLKQVFINLLKNGIEAMPDGGTIAIDLQYAPEEHSVVVRITDQGCGIPEESMSRLGEPFFSSKSSGNGLGLMVSQRIMANHKGSMAISSEVGVGTVIEIRLPTGRIDSEG